LLVGSWGAVVFYVHASGALSYNEITQESSARWANHKPINSDVISEFLGAEQDTAEIKIILSRKLGIIPGIVYETIRQAVRRGLHFPLILGGIPLSLNMWYIDNISAVSTHFAPKTGAIEWMELTVQFKEYN
jgi:phage protein U